MKQYECQCLSFWLWFLHNSIIIIIIIIIIIFNISMVLLIIKDQKCFTCLKNKIVNLIKIINVEVIKSI